VSRLKLESTPFEAVVTRLRQGERRSTIPANAAETILLYRPAQQQTAPTIPDTDSGNNEAV